MNCILFIFINQCVHASNILRELQCCDYLAHWPLVSAATLCKTPRRYIVFFKELDINSYVIFELIGTHQPSGGWIRMISNWNESDIKLLGI